MPPPTETKPNNIVILLGVLLFVVVAVMVVYFGMGPSRTARTFPAGSLDTAYVWVEDRGWLIRDRGGDGTVDCFTRLRTLTCSDVYQRPGSDCCRTKMGSAAHVMDDSMAHDLSALIRLKNELQASHTSVLDTNGDGTADCVVSAHNQSIVHIAAPDGGCPAAGEATFTEESRVRYTEVLAIEEKLRKRVARD